jgi:hypothetical protein
VHPAIVAMWLHGLRWRLDWRAMAEMVAGRVAFQAGRK